MSPPWCNLMRMQRAVSRERRSMKKPRPARRVGVRRASVTFDAQDYTEMETLSKEKKVSVAWLVREAVSQYLRERTPLFRSTDKGSQG